MVNKITVNEPEGMFLSVMRPTSTMEHPMCHRAQFLAEGALRLGPQGFRISPPATAPCGEPAGSAATRKLPAGPISSASQLGLSNGLWHQQHMPAQTQWNGIGGQAQGPHVFVPLTEK
eukprot:6490981-Amphidinium_carterae.1